MRIPNRFAAAEPCTSSMKLNSFIRSKINESSFSRTSLSTIIDLKVFRTLTPTSVHTEGDLKGANLARKACCFNLFHSSSSGGAIPSGDCVQNLAARWSNNWFMIFLRYSRTISRWPRDIEVRLGSQTSRVVPSVRARIPKAAPQIHEGSGSTLLATTNVRRHREQPSVLTTYIEFATAKRPSSSAFFRFFIFAMGCKDSASRERKFGQFGSSGIMQPTIGPSEAIWNKEREARPAWKLRRGERCRVEG